ncbi:DNA-binding transcriptional regulator, FadR family [Roseateles sp. YR242]|uniref:FadR/GntR family transcriptional regulator n=1 Tax=Roseateles sp. YR242 TaxID=1855305 RepID=UPI0008D45B88|nr:FadR/GntR family transcriptional regulator [Roseateles sp. YR242]SEK55040.1 DNA-binding transcriptional regulator, FadR family [Roseateles sp. YR242]
MNARPSLRRPRSLAHGLVDTLGERIRTGLLASGDKLPTEAAIMAEFSVSRTVVREAISKLQAAGQVETRHGIGTFVLGMGEGGTFRISPDQMATLNDVVAVLELRIGLETEAAALAAQRRSETQLIVMREALAAFAAAAEAGRDAVGADFLFHLEIARATGNPHFEQLMTTLGAPSIPRARLASLAADQQDPAAQREYLHRVNAEHESILNAIAARDSEAARAAMRTHLGNSRERRRRAALTLQDQTAA